MQAQSERFKRPKRPNLHESCEFLICVQGSLYVYTFNAHFMHIMLFVNEYPNYAKLPLTFLYMFTEYYLFIYLIDL